jgi:molybdenum cofactor synthesis domain-containing protein
VARAAILTIGNEIVSGDTENRNASWLARRLERLGLQVGLIVAVPDELETIAHWVREAAGSFDVLLVTGGLGGTPDDITRESVAAAFGVEQEEVPELAAELRARFRRHPEYAARFAQLPAGSRPLRNPLGGAPGFALANVYVLPGLPAEMKAMFDLFAGELGTGVPIDAWRRTYRTTEAAIARLLEEAVRRFPGVLVGSYPTFEPAGPRVEVVLKSAEADALAAASEWLEAALAVVVHD